MLKFFIYARDTFKKFNDRVIPEIVRKAVFEKDILSLLLVLFIPFFTITLYLKLNFVTHIYPLYLGIMIWTILVSINLAKVKNQSRLDWGLLSSYIPFLVPLILYFIKKRSNPAESKALKAWKALKDYYNSLPLNNTSTFELSKTCTACGKEVPLSSKPGQKCPHCRAIWSKEIINQK